MLNVSQAIWNEIRNNIYLEDQSIEKLKKLFKYYNIGDYIYVGVIKRKISVDIETAISILNILQNHGLVEINYGYYCFDCEKYCSSIYETYGKLPLMAYCDHCERELTFSNNSILLYKVIKTNE